MRRSGGKVLNRNMCEGFEHLAGKLSEVMLYEDSDCHRIHRYKTKVG